MNDYDVIVVGGGPVGSTFARYAADKGLKVAIVEKKKEIGVPLQCAGLLGKKIKDVNILPNEFIINEIYGAYLHSPSNITLSVSKKEPEAYVIDRVAYDKFLAQLAVDNGAELLLNHRVNDVNIETGELYLNKNRKISADVIVGADGHSSIISKQLNSSSINVQAAQYLVDMGTDTINEDYVHLYVNEQLSPGFLWIIPLSKSLARVGLFANSNYHNLNNILKDFLSSDEKFKKVKVLKKYHGSIPVYDPKKKLVKERAILIGDAASQAKPTTGGGLIIGFICARTASEIVYNAIESENPKILQDYEAEYRKTFKTELKAQLKVQKTYELLNDDDLDSMFLKLKEKDAERIISEYGDMDSQSLLVKEMLKSGLLFSILPNILSRKISSLWK